MARRWPSMVCRMTRSMCCTALPRNCSHAVDSSSGSVITLTCATPVTVNGTPSDVSTFSQTGFNVITSKEILLAQHKTNESRLFHFSVTTDNFIQTGYKFHHCSSVYRSWCRSTCGNVIIAMSHLAGFCQSDAEQFWRQDFCRPRTTSLEQSAAQSQTMWAVIRTVQVVTEDIFIQTLRPQCNVLFLTAPNRNILTYLGSTLFLGTS